MSILLEVNNFSVDFPTRKGDFHALRDVSFHLKRGEILGIVGESGAGKSTIGNAIIQLLTEPGRISGGDVRFDGESLYPNRSGNIQDIRGAKIGYIFQDPMTSLNSLIPIGAQITETICHHLGLDESAARQKAIQLLTEVGIPEPDKRLHHYPHQFSGGMRQRVVIAIALSCDPDMLIADEPTTALDASIQEQILDLLKQLCVKRELAILLITHDMGVVKQHTDRIMVMYMGELLETGSTAAVLSNPQHNYTKGLIKAVPTFFEKMDVFPTTDYIEQGTDQAQLSDDFLHYWSRGYEAVASDYPALEAEDIDISFVVKNAILPSRRTYLQALNKVSLTIDQGSIFGLVGESGSGKSTLAKIIAGLYAADSGNLSLYGHDISQLNRQTIRLRQQYIQMIFQNPYSSLNNQQRVGALLEEPILLHRLGEKHEVKSIVANLLELVGLSADDANRYPHQFSGGQRQRISIARALALKPRLLIADEPTSALDVSVQAQVLNLLKDIQKELSLSILLISHDLPVIRQMSDRVAIMQHGEVIEQGDTETVMFSPSHAYTKHLIDIAPKFDLA